MNKNFFVGSFLALGFIFFIQPQVDDAQIIDMPDESEMMSVEKDDDISGQNIKDNEVTSFDDQDQQKNASIYDLDEQQDEAGQKVIDDLLNKKEEKSAQDVDQVIVDESDFDHEGKRKAIYRLLERGIE